MVRIIVEIVSKFHLHDLLEEKKNKVWEKDIGVNTIGKNKPKRSKERKRAKLSFNEGLYSKLRRRKGQRCECCIPLLGHDLEVS